MEIRGKGKGRDHARSSGHAPWRWEESTAFRPKAAAPGSGTVLLSAIALIPEYLGFREMNVERLEFLQKIPVFGVDVNDGLCLPVVLGY